MLKMLQYLRKFSLSHCDLPTMIENVAFFLRILTVNIEKKYTKRIPTIFYVTTILTGAVYFYVYQVSMIWFVFIRCRKTGDLVAASVVFSLAACSLTGVAKLIYMRIYSDTVINIVEEYLSCDASVDPASRFHRNILKALRNVKWLAMAFWLFLVVNGALYVGLAIILPGRHFVEDLYVIYGLEPMFETPNYEIAFTMMTAGIYFGISAATNVTAFMTILAGYTEAQLYALSEEINNLWDDASTFQNVVKELNGSSDNSTNKIRNEYIKNQLKDIVKRHKTSIHLIGQLGNLFSGMMSVEFGCLTSAVIAELLGGLENTYMQLPYTLLQVMMDCLIGQRLIDASLTFENAVYSCKWENFDASNQRTVYLILMNSQKTLTLSVGGVTILSFTFLMSVLNAIYSAYTTLRTRISSIHETENYR